MNKATLLTAICRELESALRISITAADQARATATDKENVAENKYDTLGLEAAYLAHGQSERALQLEKALAAYQLMTDRASEHSVAAIGSLVEIEDEEGNERFLFIGPASGGLLVYQDKVPVTVITPDSPLGKALTGTCLDDHLDVTSGQGTRTFRVTGLW